MTHIHVVNNLDHNNGVNNIKHIHVVNNMEHHSHVANNPNTPVPQFHILLARHRFSSIIFNLDNTWMAAPLSNL